MSQLQPIALDQLSFNPFDKIGKEWFLVTAGTPEHHNTMTASWGTMGIFWSKPVVNVFVRPQRYTHEFLEAQELFTLSFLGDDQRDTLNLCGSKSGRDCDKAKECGLTPIALSGGIAFAEANLVFVCRKLYRYTLQASEMIDPTLEVHYPDKDYHDCYFAEIIAAYQTI